MMPYDPINDADIFRHALKEMRTRKGLSRKAVVEMWNGAYQTKRKQHMLGEPKMSFSEASLERFEKGIAVKKILELHFLWELLEQHPVYGEYLRNAKPIAPTASPDAPDFAAALAAFFGNPRTETLLADAHTGFPGEYVMTRRDFDERPVLPDGVRVSRLRISETTSGLLVEEYQDYQQREDVAGYRQHDTGYLFAYGRYLYFLLRELNGSGVKLGVITYHEPDRGSPVQYFEGMLYVSSNRHTFPRACIFCRRIGTNGDPMPSGYMRLSDISDTMAKNYITDDFE